MSLSGVKMIVVLAFMALSLCSAKSVGLSSLTNLAQVSAQSDETVACQYCNDFVKGCDEHGVKSEYNTSEKMARGLQELCPQVPQGSPDAEFCKAIEGNYRVFTDAYFQHREHPEVDPCKVAGVCSAKSVGFKKLASLSKVGFSSLASLAQDSAQSDETVACQFCNDFVKGCDEQGIKPEYNTSEKLSKGLQEICPQVRQGSPDEQFCKALEGKFDVFADAYFQHREHPEVDPCKVAEVCPAKSVGFKNFALSDAPACDECKELVTILDERAQKPEDTPEKLAKDLQESCAQTQHGAPGYQLCKALEGKFDVFADAYFQHREHPEVDPCKVAEVCPAKSVGFKNLAKLSRDFLNSD